jgi:hypothetical protein
VLDFHEAIPLQSRYREGDGYDLQTAKSYYELVELLRMRRIRLGLPQLEVDQIAGFQDGYCGKLERPLSSYGRHARWTILEYWMETLDVQIALLPVRRKGGKKKEAIQPAQIEFDFQSLNAP